ncbi:MAG: Gfo/Idh/MocA family oxidoreductase [Enterocloster bolteae]|uniref:Gfo/Idh/MocA family oxidoreductase n=1 Tax=Enterocloster bolteae TaxID=208479 RepID=UPI003995117D
MKKVITYGSFDLFHEGHYRLLKRAKELGDYLIVGVTTEHYDESRGKLNVEDSLMERVEHVKQTGLADEIIIEDHVGQKVEDIQKYGVDIFTIGSDWLGAFDYLKQYCEVVYLERTKDVSSTMLRAKNFSLVRLGIIGSGRIADRMIPEIRYVSGVNAEGVYNPHVKSACRFAEAHELKFYTDKIEEFLGQVDAVYIASPHATHYEYTKQALLAGKHVLCEKPMALKKAEAEELFGLAKEKNCVLMEGIKTAYCPGFVQMLGIARSGVIGAIKDVEACFTKLTSSIMRELTDVETGGSFTELGSYPLLAIIKLLGADYQSLRFESFEAPNGVDIYTKAYFKYPLSMATSKTGLGVKSEGQLLISGTRGYIRVDAPWWKTQSFEVCYEETAQNERYFVKFLGDGLRYEMSDFISALNGNTKGDFKLTADESIAMAELMELFLQKHEDKRVLLT